MGEVGGSRFSLGGVIGPIGGMGKFGTIFIGGGSDKAVAGVEIFGSRGGSMGFSATGIGGTTGGSVGL
jgi:hypothetical protein